MADLTPSIFTGVFRRPFAEQVAFFRAKLGNLVPTQFWDDLQKAEHDRAFMVAGAAKVDLLQDLAAAIDKAIAQGAGLEAFRKDFFDIVQRHGWTDYTGSGTAGGRAWRTRVIYTTNMQSSYNTGRLAQLRAGNFSLWVYKHADGEMYPRPIHESWDGLVLPPDHPFWKTHYPQNGWGCKCYVLGARGPASARALGGDPDKQLPDGWDATDPTTGEQPGIDQGWGYMPGDTVSDVVNVAAKQTQQWDYTLAKAYMQDAPEATRDALATAYRKLPSTADESRRYAQRALSTTTPADVPPYQTLGLATSQQVERINTLVQNVDIAGFDFALDRSTITHVQKHHGTAATEAPRGQTPVTAADYALLPQLLNAPDSVGPDGDSDVGRPIIVLEKVIDGRKLFAAFEIRKGRKMLALQSFWIGKP